MSRFLYTLLTCSRTKPLIYSKNWLKKIRIKISLEKKYIPKDKKLFLGIKSTQHTPIIELIPPRP